MRPGHSSSRMTCLCPVLPVLQCVCGVCGADNSTGRGASKQTSKQASKQRGEKPRQGQKTSCRADDAAAMGLSDNMN